MWAKSHVAFVAHAGQRWHLQGMVPFNQRHCSPTWLQVGAQRAEDAATTGPAEEPSEGTQKPLWQAALQAKDAAAPVPGKEGRGKRQSGLDLWPGPAQVKDMVRQQKLARQEAYEAWQAAHGGRMAAALQEVRVPGPAGARLLCRKQVAVGCAIWPCALCPAVL